MDKLNFEELERIPIPEGLEERLSARIDEWERKSLTPALSEEEEAIYNVAGQRLNKMQKGINIRNGKKVLIK